MKNSIALLLCFSFAALAQPTLTITGPTGSVRAGATVQLNVVLSGSAGLNLQSLEFGIANGSGLTCSVGAASTAAAKQLAAAASSGNLLAIAFGLNQNNYADGVVATCQLVLPLSTQGGTIPFNLQSLLGADINGQGVAIVSGPPFVLSTVSACAITGNASVGLADVLAMIQQILAGNPSPTLDLNADGVVNLIDVQRVIDAAVPNGVCKVGQ